MARETGGKTPRGNAGGFVIKDAFNISTKTLESLEANPSSYDSTTAELITELKSVVLQILNNTKGG